MDKISGAISEDNDGVSWNGTPDDIFLTPRQENAKKCTAPAYFKTDPEVTQFGLP